MSGHPILAARPDHAAAAAAARRGGVPAHGHPAVRGPAQVDQGARSRHGSRPPDHAGGAEGRRQGRAQVRRHVRGRLRVEHPADAEAARRHGEGAGRRHPARQHQADLRQRRAFRGRGRADPAVDRSLARDRGAAPRGDAAVRPVRQAEQEDPAGDPDLHRRHRRPGPPGRHHRRAPAAEARGQAVGARPVRGRQAAGAAARAAGARGRHPAGGKAHPRPRQAPDGEEPARVLPERAGQGHPEGTRRRRRRRRPRRARKEDRRRAHAQGSAQEGRRRAEEAQADVADVGRGHGGAQLHRHAGQPAVGQEDQDQARPRPCRGGAQRRPLRAGEGQGPHPRVPRGAAARRQGQGADPVPGRASGRGQDLARPERGARHRAQVRAHGAGRRARRGRDPRPPPHLHRLDAGQGAAEPDQGRHAQPAVPARRDRQAGHGLPRRPVERAARGARPRAEPHASATTTSRSTSTCPT